jgi:hypothetical protein
MLVAVAPGDTVKGGELASGAELIRPHHKDMADIVGECVRFQNVAVGVHSPRDSGRGARVIDRREDPVSAQYKAMVRAASRQCGCIIPDDVSAGCDRVGLGVAGAGKIDRAVFAPAFQETVGHIRRGEIEASPSQIGQTGRETGCCRCELAPRWDGSMGRFGRFAAETKRSVYRSRLIVHYRTYLQDYWKQPRSADTLDLKRGRII